MTTSTPASTAPAARPSRSVLVAVGWGVAIVAGTMLLPGAGLVVALVAAFTTYRRSDKLIKAVLAAAAIISVVIQLSTVVTIGHSTEARRRPS